jgi:integrase
MHNNFTLYARKVPSGVRVFYYYAYDGEGKRLGPWTTGQSTKTAARNFCNSLIKQGKLLPTAKGMPTFAEYALGFWDWENSPYLKERKKRRELTQAYADMRQRIVETNLIPYFGKMKLDKITGEVIDGWLDFMIKEKYKNTTTNGYYGALMTMIKYAVRKRVIDRDPFLDVQRLIDDTSERKLITHDEFRALFVDDWRSVWDNDLLRCTANKLAALTGMRCSEVFRASRGICL